MYAGEKRVLGYVSYINVVYETNFKKTQSGTYQADNLLSMRLVQGWLAGDLTGAGWLGTATTMVLVRELGSRAMGRAYGVQHVYYGDVIMGTIAAQITSLTIVYSTVYSGADQRKHQSSTSLVFVRGIHRGPMNSPRKWPVTRKMFPFDDVISRCDAGRWREHAGWWYRRTSWWARWCCRPTAPALLIVKCIIDSRHSWHQIKHIG